MLENFDPNTIEDEVVRQVVLYLMNQVENQHAKLQEKDEEIQRLRDEVNRLKGEQGKPKIKANKAASNLSSEKERRESKPHHEASKQAEIRIDRVARSEAGSPTTASRCKVQGLRGSRRPGH